MLYQKRGHQQLEKTPAVVEGSILLELSRSHLKQWERLSVHF